jgi:hypothetical protein
MSSFLMMIVTRTPAWVWLILAALVALGLIQARDHVVPRFRVILQALALGGLSLWGVAGAFGLHPAVEGPWLGGVLLGLAANRVFMLPRRVQALPDGRFAIAGSWLPLAMLMTVFFMRYAVNVSLALAPALRADTGFAAIAAVLYGLPAGLMAGRALRILAQAPTLAAVKTA